MNGSAARRTPGPSAYPGSLERIGAQEADPFRALAIMGNHPVKFAVDLTDVTHRRAAKFAPHSPAGVEHRLEIGRRGSNDSKNFAGRGLLLQRLGKIAVALLQFFEQPHVLDGDHRLVGEGFQQRNLFSVNGLTSVRRIRIAPIGTPSRSNGVASMVRSPCCR